MLGTVTEVGGIGSTKFGMGVIVNTVISRAHDNYGSLKIIVISFSHYK